MHLRQSSFKIKIKGNFISEEEPQEILVDQWQVALGSFSGILGLLAF
jgi:hypothetical protein